MLSDMFFKVAFVKILIDACFLSRRTSQCLFFK